MPAIIAILLTGLRSVIVNFARYLVSNAPAIVTNILVGLGFYFVVAKPVADFGIDYIINKFNGAPGTVLETLYYLNVDDYAQIIMSAFAARKTMDAGRVMMKKRGASS